MTIELPFGRIIRVQHHKRALLPKGHNAIVLANEPCSLRD